MTTSATRIAPSSDSSVTLKAVRPTRTARVKKFLNTLMRSLASAHA